MPPPPLKHGQRRRIARIPHAAQQPVRQADNLGAHALFPVVTRGSLLNGVREDAALGVKVKDEESRKRLAGVRAAAAAGQSQRARNRARQRAAAAAVGRGRTGRRRRRLAALAPAYDELLGDGAGAAREKSERFRGHALGEDLELDVADDGHAVPGYGRGPERGVVGYAAGYRGQVRVRRGEELQGNVGGEEVLRERGLEEGW